MLTETKRKSIIHALHVFLTNPINIYPVRESDKYLIAYEPKRYRIHSTIFKIDKNLINKTQSNAIISTMVDINIREDYRLSIKTNNHQWHMKAKNITIRIIPTRYPDLPPLYATLYYFEWRRTNAGGRDFIEFSIPECPLISNGNTVTGVCYKRIASQISGGGTHALQTYIILAPQKGQYVIGKWIKVSNETFHTYETPVTVSL